MGRLKKLKFETSEEMVLYYEENYDKIAIDTLNILEKHWDKNNILKDVDIYEVDIKTSPNHKYISILKDEWESNIDEILAYAEIHENYDLAIKARNFDQKVFKKSFET